MSILKNAILFRVCFLSLAVFAAVFGTSFFVSHENFIYFWDWSSHWDRYKQLGFELNNSFPQGMEFFKDSFRSSEYNLLPALLLQPFYFLFGPSRLGFILGITSVFALPSMILLTFLLERLGQLRDQKGWHVFLAALITATLIPQFWIPTLAGYVGAAGLFPVILVIMLVTSRPLTETSIPLMLIVGFLLSLAVLSNRWYGFFMVSFLSCYAISAALSLVLHSEKKITRYLSLSLKLAACAGIAAFLLAALTGPVLVAMVNTNYADIYSAYNNYAHWFSPLEQAFHYFGGALCLLAAAGCLSCLIKPATTNISAFLLFLTVLMFFHFTRVQQIMVHHYLLFLPTLSIFVFFAILDITSFFKQAIMKGLVIALYFFFSVFHCLLVFVPQTASWKSVPFPLFSHFRSYPKQRTDLPEIQALLAALNQLASTDNDLVYVLSNSFTLNDDIVRNGCMEQPTEYSFCKRVLATHQVDKRDGFPKQIFLARYFLTTEPIGYSLRPTDQMLVGLFAEEINTRHGEGTPFIKRARPFKLENNVETFIYERTAAFPAERLDLIHEKLAQAYPTHQSVHSFNKNCAMIVSFMGGKQGGSVSCENDYIYLHPGTDSATEITLDLGGQYELFQALFTFINPETISKTCPPKSGEVFVSVFADNKEVEHRLIDYQSPFYYSLDTTRIKQLKLVVDKGLKDASCDWFALGSINISHSGETSQKVEQK